MAYSGDDLKRIGLVLEETTPFTAQRWKIIPPISKNPETNLLAHRLNGLGSFYYFLKIILRKNRLYEPLHRPMCQLVERPKLKEVIQIPRDHFKTTVYSEGYPMWSALPFTERDADAMRLLGYSEEFLRWMRYAHDQDTRILLISETIKNAIKLGTRISGHYENNDFFRLCYPEIQVDSSCKWQQDSMQHKRTGLEYHGEGTYDFIGVGGALQSRHYKKLIEDDMVGRAALESEVEMQGVIDYHKLLVGAMDSVNDYGPQDIDEIVVGNRWAYYDLNSYIQANEPYFNFNTHSALGGCCKLHPMGVPIFPTEFSLEKLARFKSRLGTYFFSCQFLNEPVNPTDVHFDIKQLRYFKFEADKSKYEDQLDEAGNSTGKRRYKVNITHPAYTGAVLPDINPAKIRRVMIIDPNHSGNDSRCRHAIAVTGVMNKPRRIYLLDVWAEMSSPEIFIQTIFNMALAWKIKEIYLETIAAQKYLKYHLDYLLRQKRLENEFYRVVRFIELKTPKTKNAKEIRIESLGPIFERGEFFIPESGVDEFLDEYKTYPAGKLRDVLDVLGYGPQVWDANTSNNDVGKIFDDGLNRYLEAKTIHR